jgi:hypothetical protein
LALFKKKSKIYGSKSFQECLAAAKEEGAAVEKNGYCKMAEANKASLTLDLIL